MSIIPIIDNGDSVALAVSHIGEEASRLADVFGRHYAKSNDPEDRAKAAWYLGQARFAEHLIWHFYGGAEEDGSEPPKDWIPREELPAVKW